MAYLLFALLALAVIALASAYDTDRDWISGIAAKGENGCTFVPPPKNRDAPSCAPPNNPVTKADVASVAWKLAPKVYFHPLELHHLADPKAWLERTPIFNITATNWTLDDITREQSEPFFTLYETRTGPMNVASALINPAMQNFSTDYLHQKTSGDPISPDGSSTAKVYYTIGDPNIFNETMTHAYVITYHYYYEHNGCSNQLYAMNLEGKFQGAEYFMCSIGVHEGDLERITLYVCQSDIEALMADTSDKIDSRDYTQWIQYAAHSWSNTYNCQEGECNGEETPDDITRPVSYTGLFSHASYPFPSPLVVYQKVQVDLLAHIEGMYIGDRTSDQGAYFIPTAENTLYIKAVDEMSDAEKYGDLKWGAYPGSWGGGFPKTESVTLTCLYDNLTRFGKCDEENPATHFLKRSIERLGRNVELDLWTTSWTCAVPYDDPYEDYSFMWRWDRAAPLWKSTSSDHVYRCPFSGHPNATRGDGDSYESPDNSIYKFLGAVVGLLLGCAILYGLSLWLFVFNAPVPSSQIDQEDSAGLDKNDNLKEQFLAARPFLWFLACFSVYICGLVLVAIGITEAFAALSEVVSVSLWGTLKEAFNAVVALFGVVQVIFFIFTIFVRSQDIILWSGKTYRNPITWRKASKAGCDSVVSTVTSLIDDVTGQSVSNLCLDLNSIGINKQFCGRQLTHVCSLWAGLRIDYLVYGSFIFILSHAMFLASSAFNCQSLHQQQRLQQWQSLY
eukprot:gene16326-22516_t